jgi:hypothetical protein
MGIGSGLQDGSMTVKTSNKTMLLFFISGFSFVQN